jgi:glycosyltransferase involved in cell wall biosynthesis
MVSVILPTYNRLTWLPASVASVQAQTGVDWELVLVDDGSTDGTAEWVRTLAEPRLRYIPIEHIGNIASVFNAGLDAARGEWVAFLASDDLWPKDKLVRQFARLKDRPEAEWCYGDYRIINEQGAPIPRPHGGPWHPRDGWIAEAILRRETVVALQTLLMKTGRARQLRFDPATHLSEDYDFALRLATEAPGCALNEPLADIRVHSNRTTTLTGGFKGHVAKAIVFKKAMKTLPTPELRQLAAARYREHVRAFTRAGIRRGALLQLLSAWRSVRESSEPEREKR